MLCREKVAATVLIRKVRKGPMRIDPLPKEPPGCFLGQELSRPAMASFSLPRKRTYKHLSAMILARQSKV